MTVAEHPRLPVHPRRTLGVGLDLPWGAETGWHTDSQGRDAPSDRLLRFVQSLPADLGHLFVSWQPRSRGQLRIADYAPAWDALMAAVPSHIACALHHTALNLAHSSRYDRSALFPFTNALCERYNLGWINEDLGFWSLDGLPLPYPLPPLLTDDGLAVCVQNAAACQDALNVPLLVEFPGFSEDWSLIVGEWDAYDYFREVVQRSNSPCTLDIGHLLSWRWAQGHRGEALYDGLDCLPVDRCFEIHLSGAAIRDTRFYDTHQGVLLPEQLTLLDRLLPRCPNVRAVTFEDPVLTAEGTLSSTSQQSLDALRSALSGWLT